MNPDDVQAVLGNEDGELASLRGEEASQEVDSRLQSLRELNTCRYLLDGVGGEVLAAAVQTYLGLLGTSAIVYEANGDYALVIISSPYCRLLDEASRAKCGEVSDAEALASGRWLFHEACWIASLRSMQDRAPVDAEGPGGLRVYAAPILSGKQVIGSINFSYGSPPEEDRDLVEVAEEYQVDFEKLRRAALPHRPRSQEVVKVAKAQLEASASLIARVHWANREMREARGWLRRLMDRQRDGATIMSGNRIVRANPVMATMYGYEDPQEMEGLSELDLVAPQSIDDVRSRIEARRPGEPVEETYVCKGARKDGSVIDVEVAVTTVRTGDTMAMMTIHRDVTERIQLEQQLLEADKMRAVGTLAGGIAHDFNNILSGIVGSVAFLKRSIDRSHPNYQDVETIERLGLRAADLTKKILGFARGGKYEVKSLDVNQIMEEVVGIISSSFDPSIAVLTELQEDLRSVEGDAAQIQSVIMNLCINARDAMPEGGTLTLRTRNVTLDEDSVGSRLEEAPGDYVQVAVADTGVGMEQDVMGRVFEPFFTTKEVGKGTGLGLAMAYGIIKDHGGHILVDSKVGEGSTFTFRLPASVTPVTATQEGDREETPGGGETILVVDDEDQVLRLAKRILESYGYRVLLADEGSKAVETLRSNQGEIDLVILDIGMPGMGGRETQKLLQELDSDLPILISSGYSPGGQAEGMLAMGAQGFLPKPYQIDDLARAVRRILDSL
jgi:PAS domain S-box-containing protein